jgi:hypothetical protein
MYDIQTLKKGLTSYIGDVISIIQLIKNNISPFSKVLSNTTIAGNIKLVGDINKDLGSIRTESAGITLDASSNKLIRDVTKTVNDFNNNLASLNKNIVKDYLRNSLTSINNTISTINTTTTAATYVSNRTTNMTRLNTIRTSLNNATLHTEYNNAMTAMNTFIQLQNTGQTLSAYKGALGGVLSMVTMMKMNKKKDNIRSALQAFETLYSLSKDAYIIIGKKQDILYNIMDQIIPGSSNMPNTQIEPKISSLATADKNKFNEVRNLVEQIETDNSLIFPILYSLEEDRSDVLYAIETLDGGAPVDKDIETLSIKIDKIVKANKTKVDNMNKKAISLSIDKYIISQNSMSVSGPSSNTDRLKILESHLIKLQTEYDMRIKEQISKLIQTREKGLIDAARFLSEGKIDDKIMIERLRSLDNKVFSLPFEQWEKMTKNDRTLFYASILSEDVTDPEKMIPRWEEVNKRIRSGEVILGDVNEDAALVSDPNLFDVRNRISVIKSEIAALKGKMAGGRRGRTSRRCRTSRRGRTSRRASRRSSRKASNRR